MTLHIFGKLPKPSWVSASNHCRAAAGIAYRDEPLHLRPYSGRASAYVYLSCAGLSREV
jgi:hypothetical protein